MDGTWAVQCELEAARGAVIVISACSNPYLLAIVWSHGVMGRFRLCLERCLRSSDLIYPIDTRQEDGGYKREDD